jgi:uncharacterized protein YvpB
MLPINNVPVPINQQALTDVLGCNGIKQQNLSGKDVQSLADLLLNKKSQVSITLPVFYKRWRLENIKSDTKHQIESFQTIKQLTIKLLPNLTHSYKYMSVLYLQINICKSLWVNVQ